MTELKENAKYGRFAFDHYVLEHWSNDPSKTSEQQWESLVWEYQKMTLIQRWPYQLLSESVSPIELSHEQITFISQNQTTRERNITIRESPGIQTFWLRTCYDPALDTKYQFLKQAAGAGISDCLTEVLDDINRYNFTENWRQILTRIPGLTDSYGVIEMDGDGSNLQYKSGQDDEELIELANEDWEGDACLELAMTQLRIQAGIHLLDTGAIEEGLVRVLWLDEHGKCVWENTLDPVACDMDGLAGALMNYTSLVEITGYDGVKGALIQR